MTTRLFLLILASVSLSALAQLALKLGVDGSGDARADAGGLAAMLASPLVLGGLALYGVGAVVWLFVLGRAPLSLAYPFVGMGFILTASLGVLVLGETLNASRIAGTLLIALGCVLVARSA
jgi:drug/metabolite transporter (DMT)-like permease